MTKILVSLKPLTSFDRKKEARCCMTCDKPATQEAWFDVGGDITVVEKYCKDCSESAIR